MTRFTIHAVLLQFFLVPFTLLLPASLTGQEIYIPIDGAVYKIDVNQCEKELIVDLNGYREDNPMISSCVFHPDGSLYIFTEAYIYKYIVLQREFSNRIRSNRIGIPWPFYAAIDDQGSFYISSGQVDQIQDFMLEEQRGINFTTIENFKTLHDRYIGGFIDDYLLSSSMGEHNGYHLWDLEGYNEFYQYEADYDFDMIRPVLYYPPCEEPKVIGIGKTESSSYHLLMMDHQSMTITELCEDLDLDLPEFYVQMGTTTGFRQSGLRLDLDQDNSSFHLTDGYYDTLSNCSEFIPLCDDDILITTCGQAIDSIGYTLYNYDIDPLESENLFIENAIRRSPSRWIWKNPYGHDMEKVKNHMRSAKYVLNDNHDFDHTSRFFRSVVITLYSGNDSTSSWTVIVFKDDSFYAGKDTAISYCPGTIDINLRNYQSEGTFQDGYFIPGLKEDWTFQPGVDADGTYLYITGNATCADTAVYTIRAISHSISMPDTLEICPEGSATIGFPPGQFSDIHWWDGSKGDSIHVTAQYAGSRHFEILFEDCRLMDSILILITPMNDIAGADTVLAYCPGDPEIDLSRYSTAPSPGNERIVPELHLGGWLFSPGIDPPGDYLYIVDRMGCNDTAVFTLNQTATQELPFEPVFQCVGQEVRVGLPSGMYTDIQWWNGDRGDSTVVMTGDPGPFYVEAEKDGCIYRNDFEVIENDPGDFINVFPDTVEHCPGEASQLSVMNMDSVIFNGHILMRGEPILIPDPGPHTLIGFNEGCVQSKNIYSHLIKDPSALYHEFIYWCPDSPLTLVLPGNSSDISFSWTDGMSTPEREVLDTGYYEFTILSKGCSFQSGFSILPADNTNCRTDDCIIVIPNAISPNGDGWNDDLEVILPGKCGTVELFEIWDKWGNLLYNGPMTSYHGWKNLIPGPYVVRISFQDHSGRTQFQSQTLTVIH